MTDLIKFLRTSTSSAYNKVAADRIEQLNERLTAATDDAKEAEAYAEQLEAKLTKAVEALRVISQFGAVTNSARNVHAIFNMTDRARKTLAELEVEPLSAKFEAVWDANKDKLYEE